MNWKAAYRSFYYQDAPEPEVPSLPAAETALLCIDVQNYGLAPQVPMSSTKESSKSSI